MNLQSDNHHLLWMWSKSDASLLIMTPPAEVAHHKAADVMSQKSEKEERERH